MAAQNLPKTVFQSIKNNVTHTTQEVIKDSVSDAAEQIGVPIQQNQQQPQEEFDTESYRANLQQEEAAKMQELKQRLAQIQSEVSAARQQRVQREQEYSQHQEELMRQPEAEKLEQQQKQEASALPQAVKSRQGTSEAGRRNRKG